MSSSSLCAIRRGCDGQVGSCIRRKRWSDDPAAAGAAGAVRGWGALTLASAACSPRHRSAATNGVGRTYRYFNPDTPLGPALFPFGAGLSYTTFAVEWEQPPAATLCIDCGGTAAVVARARVTNTGRVAGAKVVMAFVAEATPRHVLHGEHDCGGVPCDRLAPHKSLYAMQKVHLVPGASAVLEFPVDVVPREPSGWCAFCTVTHNGTRLVAPGEYVLSIGGDGSVRPVEEVRTVISLTARAGAGVEVPLMRLD